MKSKKMILPMVCCIPLLSSCISPQASDKQTWNIKPVYKVNNVAADNPVPCTNWAATIRGSGAMNRPLRLTQSARADGSYVEAHNGLGVIYSMQSRL